MQSGNDGLTIGVMGTRSVVFALALYGTVNHGIHD